MATKRKGILGRIGDSIGNLMRQPMSDESNEVPSPKSVSQGKKVAAGTKKRSTTKKAKTASRKTKKR